MSHGQVGGMSALYLQLTPAAGALVRQWTAPESEEKLEQEREEMTIAARGRTAAWAGGVRGLTKRACRSRHLPLASRRVSPSPNSKPVPAGMSRGLVPDRRTAL